MLVYLLFAIGLVLLLFGGEWLVRGAVGLAEKFKVSPLVIGLTIVAFGTSAPELVISLKAALGGSGGLAVGNIVGSNIANVLLVLGAPALLATISCGGDGLKGTLIFLIALTGIFMMQMVFGPIGRFDGIILLVLLVGFLLQQFLNSKRQAAAGKAEDEDYHDEIGEVPTSLKIIIAYLVAGLITLPLGATLTVDAAVEIATRWNISKEVIGLTIVAFGTSLPELVTAVMAVRHGSTSLALGNVVGSNIFNIAAIMGITAFVAGKIEVGGNLVSYDMWVMLAATLLLTALALMNFSIKRHHGVLLLTGYIGYLISTTLM